MKLYKSIYPMKNTIMHFFIVILIYTYLFFPSIFYGQESTKQSSRELAVGISEMPLNFNPFLEQRYVGKIITYLLYSSIVNLRYPHSDQRIMFEHDLADKVDYMTDRKGSMMIVLKPNIFIHDNNGTLDIYDIKQTVDMISKVPQNTYKRNKMSVVEMNQANHSLVLKIGYPSVIKQRGDQLRRYLTFPIVPSGTIKEKDVIKPIDNNAAVQKYIKGSGPYTLKNFDESINKITLQRFPNYKGMKLDRKGFIDNITFNFRVKHADTINAFKSGNFQILLNHFGTPLSNSPDIVFKPDPSLNSFTCLAFNFNGNDFIELINKNAFREIVASCIDKNFKKTTFEEFPGKSMYLIDEPLKSMIKRDIFKYDLLIPEDEREKKIKLLFKDTRLKKFLNKTINIYYENYKPVYERLAGNIANWLDETFTGYLNFKSEPIPLQSTWEENIKSKRDFSMIIYTHYFGVNRVIMNSEFFGQDDNFNLTGRYIPIQKDDNDNLDYDHFLLKVNKELPVVVIGRFYRFNIINDGMLWTPRKSSQIKKEDRELLISSPLFYKVWYWQWKNY